MEEIMVDIKEEKIISWQKEYVDGRQFTYLNPTTYDIENLQCEYYYEYQRVFKAL